MKNRRLMAFLVEFRKRSRGVLYQFLQLVGMRYTNTQRNKLLSYASILKMQ